MIASSRPAIVRDWRLFALIGAGCFAVAFAVFRYAGPAADMTQTATAALLVTLAVTAGAVLVRGRALRLYNHRMRVALDNMSQGLCMFDRNERLVVCNTRYMEMYRLPPEIARPGMSLAGLLEYRAAHNTFSRNIDEYRRDGERWLFAKRKVTLDAAVPGGWAARRSSER